MESGKDVIEGGAKINSSGVAIIGLAEVVDSISAIEEVVFQTKEISFGDLLAAISTNFEGRSAAEKKRLQALQARLANCDKTPKFGNSPKANRIALWVTGLLDSEFGKHENYRGGRYRVGYWSMTNHAGFGKVIGATPSGRGRGENLPSGLTPSSGKTPYVTDALSAIAALKPESLSNGIAVNIKVVPQQEKDQLVQHLADYVKGYFTSSGGGGVEVQFNVTDRDTFIDAVRTRVDTLNCWSGYQGIRPISRI